MTRISSDNVALAYRRYAPFYDAIFGAALGAGRRRMARLVADLRPSSILEIGVGTGLTLGHYPAQARVTGIDLSPEMLARARIRADRLAGRSISLVVMDAEKLSFESGSFDCVTLPYVLSATPNPNQLASEARRVCKPGGHIVIVNHFSGSRFWRLFEWALKSSADRVGFHSDFDYSSNILAHDWKVERSVPVNLFGLSRLVVIRNT